jgi:predicted dehydrogenase
MYKYHSWSWGISNLDVTKTPDPIRFGVLGAADILGTGLVDPARTHPDVVVTAIGARSLEKAQAHAKQYGILRAFGSYQEVIEQDDIDAVYIPLPVASHAEWAIKAARAGKHVLLEKPICSNEDEAKRIRQCAQETGKVILEAFHWQFHPVNHILKALIDSGKYGSVLSIHADLWAADAFPKDDIRNIYTLGGGAAMDLGYIFSAIRYFLGPDGEYEVDASTPRLHPHDKLVDERVDAKITFRPGDSSRNPIRCTAVADLRPPVVLGIIPLPKYPTVIIELEQGTLTITK